jgi:hypothetical protein
MMYAPGEEKDEKAHREHHAAMGTVLTFSVRDVGFTVVDEK